ncbi:MAG: glycoside hydrolase family 78 protein, partial [Planctomycetaceae bacterium]|nr:glycoside hydrolase family 78 protein [Planctomycetaceae bacterium]
QVEYQTEPLGIETKTPRFSWKLSDPNFTKGQKQTAYQIFVASNKMLLSENNADIWNSGKVESDQSLLIPYNGKNELKSSCEYYWKVLVFDKDGKSTTWSEPARFVTGLLNPSDWDSAAWVKHPSAKRTQHIWFRKNIHLDNEPHTIFAHIASLGHHELYINGQKVDDSVLAPALTNFQKRLFYVTYDISRLLKKGENTIAVWFSSGWASYDCFKLPPLLRIKINGLDSANQTVTFNSDSTWRSAVSNSSDTVEIFTFNNNGGEIIDARNENQNWNKPDFDDSKWENAVTQDYNIELTAQDIPPSRIIETIHAKKIIDLGGGRYKIDFGKNFTGWLNLKFHGLSTGDKITIGSADDEKTFCDFNIRNFFIASGKDGETFQNRFNYVAGRYANLELSKFKTNGVIEIEKAVYGKLDEPAATVDTTEAVKKIVTDGKSRFAVNEITKAVGDPKPNIVKTLTINYKVNGKSRTVSVKDGETAILLYDEWKKPPRLEDCTAYAMSTDLKRTGHFKSSNELFNKIYETDIWTFFANTQEGYTSDCPHRERCGYGEVATACSWGLGLPNLDAGAYYRKVVRDWVDVQTEDGWGRHVAPQPNSVHWGGAMWASAGMNVALHHYQYYGDKQIIEAIYPTAKRWLEFLNVNTKDGLLQQYRKHNKGHFLGDWLAPHSRSEFGTSIQAVYFNNCVYAMNLETFIGFAKLLGRDDDVMLYGERLKKLRPAIHAKFYNKENATYCTQSQVQNAFALLTDITPNNERAKVAASIYNDLNGKHPYFDMGSSGLTVLLKYFVTTPDEGKTVAKILNKTEFPGYGYFIDKGESTWPEDWKIDVPSKIHTCYTGIAGWLIKGLCGIQPDAEHSGYKHFVIHPVIVDEVTFAEASIESPYGQIFSRWTRSEDKDKNKNNVTLSVVIPPNTAATVYVNGKPTEVSAGKYEFRW